MWKSITKTLRVLLKASILGVVILIVFEIFVVEDALKYQLEDQRSEKVVDVTQVQPIEERSVQTENVGGIEELLKPPSMDIIKKRGCITDGILNGHGGDSERAMKMINRSQCQYLHRSIETWLEAPDFIEIRKNKEKILKQDMIFGMFLAEAIDVKAEYFFPEENRMFDFRKMCRKGTENYWGEHTCRPSMERTEYQKYLKYITEQAMDIGIQSFMFGQIYYQDSISNPKSKAVVQEMRAYSKKKGFQIVVGAQTNDITKESFLRIFDYIEGGVGLQKDGSFENNACFSRWWKKPGDWCWALLWHEDYATKANNVLIHLDWSGKMNDDMSTFAQMDDKLRIETLDKLYNYFTDRGHGFLMPVLAVLPKENGGCYGAKKRSYSSDEKYSCGDEEGINEILKQGRKK